MHPLGEGELFALLRRVDLDDANASQGLAQTAGDLGVDLPALAEDGAELAEGERHDAAEDQQHSQGHQGQLPVEVEEHQQGQGGGEQTAHELYQTGAHQVPDALGVGHDAGDQDSTFGVVEESRGQARHVFLHPPAHLRDRRLRRHAQHLGHQERGDRLDHGGDADGEGQNRQELGPALADHLVDQELRGRR